MKIKAMFATGNRDTQNEIFSEEALRGMVDSAAGVPVTWDFDESKHLGRVTEAHFDGVAMIEADIDPPEHVPICRLVDESNVYAVPQFKPVHVADTDDGRVYQQAETLSIGLTVTPVDMTLPPIEIVESE